MTPDVAIVKQRFIHTGARKLRLIADVVRGMEVNRAHATLAVLPQRGAKTMAAILRSAQSAANDIKLDGTLVIQAVCVDEGPALKRRVLAGRGRSTVFEHRMSHVTMTLGAQSIAATKKTKTTRTKAKV